MSSPAVMVESATFINNGSEDTICRLAHDLRQPLSTIEAIAYYLEIMLPADQSEARRYLARLRQTVQESNTILSNALHETPRRPA